MYETNALKIDQVNDKNLNTPFYLIVSSIIVIYYSNYLKDVNRNQMSSSNVKEREERIA